MDQEQILGTKTYIYNKHLSDREAEFSKHFFCRDFDFLKQENLVYKTTDRKTIKKFTVNNWTIWPINTQSFKVFKEHFYIHFTEKETKTNFKILLL